MTSHDDFFETREAPAVLKHGILKRYPTVFSAAAGKRAPRVVLLDGYAGRGQYKDGSPGSPMLLLDSAARTAAFRDVQCIFVERDAQNFRSLQKVVDAHTPPDVACEALRGDLSDHLAALIRRSKNAALFAFLDPFGTALRYDELAVGVLGRESAQPTEVLLHVSVNAIRRIGGLLRKRGPDPAGWTPTETKTIERVDRFLGGPWWHHVAHSASDEEGVATKIAENVIDLYCTKVCADADYSCFSFPVKKQPAASPDYFLVLFSCHSYAFWRFNDALSSAHTEWQAAWRSKFNEAAAARAQSAANARAARRQARQADSGIQSLFSAGELPEPTPDAHESVALFDEKAEAAAWERVIEDNLQRLLARRQPFRPMDHIADVYGSTLGQAREMHVKHAFANLHRQGLSPYDGKGKVHNQWVRP